MELHIEINIAMNNADQKLVKLNLVDPTIQDVSSKVMALIIKVKKPKVNIVIGNETKFRNGLMVAFKITKITLAIRADPKLLIKKYLGNSAVIARNKTV